MDPLKLQANEDEGGFVTSLTSHQSTIHAFVISLLPGESDTEDIVQRTNLVLWNKRHQFKPGTSFKSWALTVARWEVRAWLTERKRQSWLVFNDKIVDTLGGFFEDAPPGEGADTDRVLRHCLGNLRESDRLLILSHYQHDKSLRECSRLFNRSVNALKVTLFRLRAILRRCVKARLALQFRRP